MFIISWSVAAVLILAGFSGASAGAFPVLDRPSLQSGKASSAAMLSVTRVGTRVVAVGERGIVLLSDDGGASWRQAKTPVCTTLTAVQFVGEKKGWAVGHFGVVLQTTDGGETWVKQLDGFVVGKLMLAAAERRAAAEQDVEKGESIISPAQRFVAEGPDKPFLNLFFLDDRTGFVFGAFNMIMRTEDGGLTWIPWGDHVENDSELHLYGMCAAEKSLFLAGEQGLLLRSDDGGQHFTAVSSPYEGSYFGLLGSPEGTLVLYGLRGNVFHSGDAGNTWKKIDTATLVSFSAGLSLAGGGVVLVSQAGELLVSSDGSAGFKRHAAPEPVPATGLTQSGDGNFILSSLRGMRRVSAKDLK
ncbi:MAG: YCF48-related protein [Pseudomonadota bacterium]